MTRKQKKARDNYHLGKPITSKKRHTKNMLINRVGAPKLRPVRVIEGVCEVCKVRRGVLRSDGSTRCMLCQVLHDAGPRV